MKNNKPGLGQLSILLQWILADQILAKHFIIQSEDVWDKISNITLRQYYYFKQLMINKERIKLNVLMEQLGFQHIAGD